MLKRERNHQRRGAATSVQPQIDPTAAACGARPPRHRQAGKAAHNHPPHPAAAPALQSKPSPHSLASPPLPLRARTSFRPPRRERMATASALSIPLQFLSSRRVRTLPCMLCLCARHLFVLMSARRLSVFVDAQAPVKELAPRRAAVGALSGTAPLPYHFTAVSHSFVV